MTFKVNLLSNAAQTTIFYSGKYDIQTEECVQAIFHVYQNGTELLACIYEKKEEPEVATIQS